MIDRKALEALEEARKARQDAENVGGDLEDLIEAMRRSGTNWQGLERSELDQSASRP
jgi:hypothetical protein